MLVDIKFLKQNFKKNILIFCDLNLKLNGLEQYFAKQKIYEIQKNILNQKNLIEKENIIIFNFNPNQKIIVQKISECSKSSSNEKNGANLLDVLKKNCITEINFLEKNVNFFFNQIKIL